MQTKHEAKIKQLVGKARAFKVNDLAIRYKLIALLLVISILPAIALSVLISVTVDRIVEKKEAENTFQLIEQANKSFDSYIENMESISYLISFNREINEYLAGTETDHYQIKQYLQGFTSITPEIAGILVVNSDGDYISNELYTRNKRPLTEENWYQEAVENKGIFKVIGTPSERNIASHINYKDEEVISSVRAIFDPRTQKVAGVVLIDLKLRVISEVIRDIRLGKSGYLMVLDAEDDTVYSPKNALIDEISSNSFQGHSSGTFSKEEDGTKLHFIYQKSSFSDWTTIGIFKAGESLAEVKQVHFFVISFLFIVCLVGLGASYYLSYSMSRPIGQLNSFMKEAESGNLTIRYKGDRKDEIGMLGGSFNTMLAQINNLLDLTELQARQKKEAELQALQAHIKPHFLYNTLDTINWMARKKGASDVAEVVESLSQLFRIGLSKGDDMILLDKEIEHIESYLKIQKARYQDKLNYQIMIDPTLRNVSVIKLILQPIIENAIYHGIKERRGPGCIEINGEKQNGRLVLHVVDDGKGMNEETLMKLNESLSIAFNSMEELKTLNKVGYGVMNVQARIKLTYGSPYGLSIKSEAEKGTTVKIVLPIKQGG
ncbi:cache domain-containing sensor histidine kinase [Domibacillus tundrae]|uniref:cache domain-containing sensor histidine kinase n=1 Tax=Domibacillus tundrae TaxID=1587527 RepID=UPI000617C817|nr:sensor histidine kinase [Domibacillus tundrae]